METHWEGTICTALFSVGADLWSVAVRRMASGNFEDNEHTALKKVLNTLEGLREKQQVNLLVEPRGRTSHAGGRHSRRVSYVCMNLIFPLLGTPVCCV